MARAKKQTQKDDAMPAKGPDATTVKSYAGKIHRESEKKSKHQGEVGALYKQFENMGGHKNALKLALKLEAMETANAQDFVRSLGKYCTALGIFDQGDLFEDIFAGGGASADADDDVPMDDPGTLEDGEEDSLSLVAGKAASRNGEPHTANPHPKGSDDYRRWSIGWQMAADDAADKPKRQKVDAISPAMH